MISLEYLAGFFDGEGTLYIGVQKAKHPDNKKLYKHCTVMLSQSGDKGLKLLSEISEQYGGSIYKHLDAGQHKATKAAYKLYWNKDEAVKLVTSLEPFLKIKREEAIEVIKYLTRNDDK